LPPYIFTFPPNLPLTKGGLLFCTKPKLGLLYLWFLYFVCVVAFGIVMQLWRVINYVK
jgi:hypothetical protein